MLADFQQALADLTASPELCNAVRADAGVLAARYSLTEVETRRITAVAGHTGMTCACVVYRMNRLAPLAMNVRQTLRALGPALPGVAGQYWHDHPRGHSHFHIEAGRFCRWLRQRIDEGLEVPPQVTTALKTDGAAVDAALEESHTELTGNSVGTDGKRS